MTLPAPKAEALLREHAAVLQLLRQIVDARDAYARRRLLEIARTFLDEVGA